MEQSEREKAVRDEGREVPEGHISQKREGHYERFEIYAEGDGNALGDLEQRTIITITI